MYSQRYGTLPVVRRTGGLADTVTDANAENIRNKTANGFVFDSLDSRELLTTIQRAVALYVDRKRWNQVTLTAMRQDYAWQASAEKYEALYRS